MPEITTLQVLEFLLSSYRAKLAVQESSDRTNCVFDFSSFLSTWKISTWTQLKSDIIASLEPLVREGLFDSITPYLNASLCSSTTLSDPLALELAIGKSHALTSSLLSSVTDINHGHSDRVLKVKSKDVEDGEITIHVCDEAKGVKEDFKCLQSLLLKEMGYFSKVTVKGQRLKDMDISVHCDISVFDWLMKWVRYKAALSELYRPKLEPSNVIGLLVSADFLHMPELTGHCLNFTHDHMGQVIASSPNLGCLNEALTARLSKFFDNVSVEQCILPLDKHDRITSRLYTQLIASLNDPESDVSRGHYASTATLFRCSDCDLLLLNETAWKIPCTSVRFDARGRIFASHSKDSTWSLSTYIRDLKKSLKTWRKVYWRLWATVHFFSCSKCCMYFPAKYLAMCQYHPNEETKVAEKSTEHMAQKGSNAGSSGVKRQNGRSFFSDPDLQTLPTEIPPTTYPYGQYLCCKQASFRYSPLPHVTGCQVGDHALEHYAEDNPTLKTLLAYRDLIVLPVLEGRKETMDWKEIIELRTDKGSCPSCFTATSLGPKEIAANFLGLPKGSSTESNSLPSPCDGSDGDEAAGSSGSAGDGRRDQGSTRTRISESWLWNPDLSTRYNQDMQREKEEKLMVDLALLLSQRVSLEPSIGFPAVKLGYFSRRSTKNIGGSYLKLESRWKEEHHIYQTRAGRLTRTLKQAQN